MAELDLGKVVMDSYNDLDDKPMINDVELSGNKTLEELGIKQLIDAVNVSRLSLDTWSPWFETLEEFVAATATDASVPHFGRMGINAGKWGFTTHELRYLIAYNKRYSEKTVDVGGNGIFWDDLGSMFNVRILGSVGNLKIFYKKLEPNQVPTNNLLATEPGTPLDAVQGKTLNDALNYKCDLFNEGRILTGGIWGDSTSPNLSKLGISSSNTLAEVVDKLKVNGVNIIVIITNSNNSTFNNDLPAQTGGIITITMAEAAARGCIEFTNFRTGDRYFKYTMNGTFGNWEKLVTETALGNALNSSYKIKTYNTFQSIGISSVNDIADITTIFKKLPTYGILEIGINMSDREPFFNKGLIPKQNTGTLKFINLGRCRVEYYPEPGMEMYIKTTSNYNNQLSSYSPWYMFSGTEVN